MDTNLIQIKRVLIQCAVLPEFEALRQVFRSQKIEHADHGRMYFETEDGVICLLAGMGSHHAKDGCEWALNKWKPMRVIDFGISGALETSLTIGDMILALKVKNTDGLSIDVIEEIPVEVPVWKEYVFVSGCRTTRGVLVSLDEAVVLDESRMELRQRSGGAIAVSWESFSIASICNKKNIRFLSARMISDCKEDDMQRLRSPEMLRRIRAAADCMREVFKV